MSETTMVPSPPGTAKKRQRYRLDPSRRRDYPLKHIPQALAILEACDGRGLLTNGQLSRLFFEGKPNAYGEVRELAAAEKAAAKVLQRLWEGGWLERRPVILTSKRTGGAYHHFVNVLSPAGAAVVEQLYRERGRGELRWKRPGVEISNQTIEHTLAINDVYVLVKRASERQDVAFFSWKDDRQLAAMTRAKQLHLISIPDAFFVLAKDGHPFGQFLEIDLGTESVAGERSTRIWREKIEGYARYLRERYEDEDYFEGVAAPIVLMVTTSPRRLEHMLQVTREIGGTDHFWYTTIDALTPERIVPREEGKAVAVFDPQTLWQPIWRVASDLAPRSLLTRLTGETPR